MKRIPWKIWLAMANQIYHLTPDQFWNLSVLEWQWFMEIITRHHDDFMPRNIFENLVNKYSDNSNGK